MAARRRWPAVPLGAREEGHRAELRPLCLTWGQLKPLLRKRKKEERSLMSALQRATCVNTAQGQGPLPPRQGQFWPLAFCPRLGPLGQPAALQGTGAGLMGAWPWGPFGFLQAPCPVPSWPLKAEGSPGVGGRSRTCSLGPWLPEGPRSSPDRWDPRVHPGGGVARWRGWEGLAGPRG